MSVPHLLLVALNFPPSRSSGVYRAVAVANEFVRTGWDVSVLTVEEEAWARVTGTDASLIGRVDPRVRVVRTPFSWPHLDGDLRRWSRPRIEAPYLWRELWLKRSQRNFPEPVTGRWLPTATAAADTVHAERPVDVTLATASPAVSFAVAAHLHDRAGVPYVMDYRDAWQLDTATGRRTVPAGGRVDRYERRLLDDATEVWFVNEPIRAWHARLHPHAADKMHVVANGFDDDPQRRERRPHAKRGVTFGYVGTLSPGTHPINELLDGWRLAFGADPATGILRGYLAGGGALPPDTAARLRAAAETGLTYEGPIPKAEVFEFYNRVDALILLAASSPFVTGGKVAEYLSTGMPIVSVHDRNNASRSLLDGYPLWFPAAEVSPEAIAAALRRAAAAVRDPDPERWHRAFVHGQRFSRAAQLAPRIQALTLGADRG